MHKRNHIITIFGGTGDLTYRKLLPALYNLKETGNFPDRLNIVIIGRKQMTSAEYRMHAKVWLEDHSRVKVSNESLVHFLDHVKYFEMAFTEDEGYKRLKAFYTSLDEHAQHLYYFAVAPSFFEDIALKLQKHDLVDNAKVIIEKPFGNDLETAVSINATLTGIFSEDNIYRIDHYVAKEMVQNIFTIRFANMLFQKVWNNEAIDNIQISAQELVGVENRGNYYDHTGALKDMFQNHLLQILSIVTMEEPQTMQASDIHFMQERVLEHLFIEDMQRDVVLGQYDANLESLAYREEDRVDPDSRTETFVALKLGIDLPQWRDTPIYVRTGKRMDHRGTEVIIQFKAIADAEPNVLILKIQPDEGVYVRFNIKEPGQSNTVQEVSMDFCQSCNYEFRNNTPEAYERLLNAALADDHTLFASFKQVRLSWEFVEDIMKHYPELDVHLYPAYTNGPQAAHDLLQRDHRSWIEGVYQD